MRQARSSVFDLTFLGTSASSPSAERNQPGLMVSCGGTRILVDCGEGTQRQLLRSGIGFKRIERMLLTHGHFDHVLGIPGLLSTMGLYQNPEGVTINGGSRTLNVVSRMLNGLWNPEEPPVPLRLVPVVEGSRIQEDGFTITAFPVRHRDTDSYGYSFLYPPRRHLHTARLDALSVPDGPVRKELAEGRTITLTDGRSVAPADVQGPLEPPRKLVVVGDVEATIGLEDAVRDADVLVIEATFLERDRATARDYGHLTAAEAAQFARTAGVKQLALTHVSGRYPADEILNEAKEIFDSVHVASDLEHLAV